MALDISALTPNQRASVTFWQAYNVPGEWSIGEKDSDGVVEVLMKGAGFEWSLTIDADGETMTAERPTGGEWSTGIEI